ncbi:PE-PPE domain-containing protein [[Mycobacterium] nativiensis]|uniref:PE-PPE domain-containing protein n=1 Tax=[Mycobacterium] nativiensis TaxID=2855503 RepID=A0ABU5XY87_9MYCO|nr:PE-PPE domain-containing protein [Mycolicibacter sp. MYC340]MEB3032863.1 PE-PPE domain-containing protein [Mycolicibacter sp. MYC340]
MRAFHCLPLVAGVAAAGLIAGHPMAAPVAGAQTWAVSLTGNGTALGDGTAFLMGGTGVPQPSDAYLDAADTLFLQPHGFTGDLVSLWTPENVSSTSRAVGEQILYNAILQKIGEGDVDADHPVVVLGYSQSASISSGVMTRLADADISNDLVRFVLIGSPNPTGIPDGLYHTDVYNFEYDMVAFKPTYFNPLAELNSMLGFLYAHSAYLTATPEQIASAIELPSSDPDALTTFHMLPSEILPVLAPLQLIPIFGLPLYELLEPVTRILVNLGYGSIDHGWPPGDVDVAAGSGLFPTDIDFGDLLTALGKGVVDGISNAIASLLDPDTYTIYELQDNPSLAGIVEYGYIAGYFDSPDPTLQEALAGIVNFFEAFTSTEEFPMP